MKIQIILFIVCAASRVFALSPAPQAKPKLEMLRAIELAREFAIGKVDLKDYYLERVWISHVNGEVDRKWVVSWCPDGELKKLGWFIVVVDMEGHVYLPKSGVEWIDKQTIEGIKALEKANLQMKDIRKDLNAPEKK